MEHEYGSIAEMLTWAIRTFLYLIRFTATQFAVFLSFLLFNSKHKCLVVAVLVGVVALAVVVAVSVVAVVAVVVAVAVAVDSAAADFVDAMRDHRRVSLKLVSSCTHANQKWCASQHKIRSVQIQ